MLGASFNDSNQCTRVLCLIDNCYKIIINLISIFVQKHEWLEYLNFVEMKIGIDFKISKDL